MKQLISAVFFLSIAGGATGQTVLYRTNKTDQYYDWDWGPPYDPFYNGNETGELFQLGSSNATLTGFDLNLTNFTDGRLASNHSVADVHLLITIFSGYQLNYNGTGSGPEFTNPVESVLYDLPMQFVNDHLYAFTGTAANPYFTLPNSVPVSGNLVGIQFTWLGLESGTYQPIAIQIPFDGSNAPLVGNNGLAWRGSQVEFVVPTGTDSSTSMLQNQGYGGYPYYENLDVTLYGAAAPEPASWWLLGLGGLALAWRKPRRISMPSRIGSGVPACRET